MSLIATLAVSAALGTTPANATPTPIPTTPAIVHIQPAKVIGCTQQRFRYRVRKVYAKKRITKHDHAWIYEARKCLRHQKPAIRYQRKIGLRRQARLDPWGAAWRAVDPGLKARLARLRYCESTNNYRATNGQYTGAYQYAASTWARAGGSGQAMNAPPREQDVRTARFWPTHMGEWQCKA